MQSVTSDHYDRCTVYMPGCHLQMPPNNLAPLDKCVSLEADYVEKYEKIWVEILFQATYFSIVSRIIL